MLKFLTAGESHGKAIVAILDGMVSKVKVDVIDINKDLKRRQQGIGRSSRMGLEEDRVEIISGVKNSLTTGAPICLSVANKDFNIDKLNSQVTIPRPGHADLAGAIKFNTHDIRDILERSSARETTVRVTIGAVCRSFLSEFGVKVSSSVVSICGARTESKIQEVIGAAAKKGDTVGGIFEIVVKGAPAGLGSVMQADKKLDARLACALISIQAIKAVEFGIGFAGAGLMGSQFHDKIVHSKSGFARLSNNAGGIEGGMSNGEAIVARCFMKPIPTLQSALSSIDIASKSKAKATVVRSDVCAVPAAAVIGESVVCFEIANAMLEKFGGDSLTETKRNYQGYISQIKKF